MATKKGTAKVTKLNRAGRGSILLDDELNRVQVVLDHIDGCMDALMSHLREHYDIDADSGTHAIVGAVKKWAEQASGIVGRSYGSLPAEVVEQREKNIKARDQLERETAERDAKMARQREERAAKINKALDRIA